MINEDERWMRRAIDVASSKGSDPASSPLGAVIILDGKEIAAERNQTKELPDATAHAEMMAKHGQHQPVLRCLLHPCAHIGDERPGDPHSVVGRAGPAAGLIACDSKRTTPQAAHVFIPSDREPTPVTSIIALSAREVDVARAA